MPNFLSTDKKTLGAGADVYSDIPAGATYYAVSTVLMTHSGSCNAIAAAVDATTTHLDGFHPLNESGGYADEVLHRIHATCDDGTTVPSKVWIHNTGAAGVAWVDYYGDSRSLIPW